MEDGAGVVGVAAVKRTAAFFGKGNAVENTSEKKEKNAEGPRRENGLCHIINPENHGNNIILGNGVFRIASPYTFALGIPGIGLKSTVLSEQEFAVIRPVILRMFGVS
jgi:hypothetical protein